jgi:xanthine dehydrogenase YagT iron-sulfur-binding subunit
MSQPHQHLHLCFWLQTIGLTAIFRDRADFYSRLRFFMAKDPVESRTANGSEEQEKLAPDSGQPLLGRVSRRSFLSHIGAASIAATTPVFASVSPRSPSAVEEMPSTDGVEGAVPVSLRINGKEHNLKLDPRTTLLDCLRENLNMPGTKKGCDHGQCGACTVHVNGRRVNSCLSFAVMHSMDEITTIEGIGQPDHLHPMQAAFIEHDGYQCGYCTSGQIMSAVALLKEPVGPTDEDVKQAMYGNICRCGAYPNIIAAVQSTRKQA